ncbi:transcription factor TFIIIC subunit tfc4 [Dimargaris verticillata]|uniref:Transcription factor TFIIIC subunit tfc4 n=1 Tax=Dimargaris verticillata TaxID=2761393 RepID=A0A9W8E9I2_9FUNG|nr:transcription factor TFIIIC subunit tfc4 [Dimargaris verticillata]
MTSPTQSPPPSDGEASERELDTLLQEIADMGPLDAPVLSLSHRLAQFDFSDESDVDLTIDDVDADATQDPEAAFQSFRDQVKATTGIGRAKGKRQRGRRREPKLSPEVQTLLGRANMEYVAEDYEGAIATYQEIIRLEPKVHKAWFSLAMIHEELGDKERAVMLFLVAAHITPSDGELWKRLAFLSKDQQNTDQALYCFSKAIRADPTDAEAILERAQIHVETELLVPALDDLQRYLILNPHDLVVVQSLAKLAVETSEYAPAIYFYEQLFYQAYVDAQKHSDPPPSSSSADQAPERGPDFTFNDLNMFAELCMLAGEYDKLIFHIRHGARLLQYRSQEQWWSTDDELDAIMRFLSSGDPDDPGWEMPPATTRQVVLPARGRAQKSSHVKSIPATPTIHELMQDPDPKEIAILGEYLGSHQLKCLVVTLNTGQDWSQQGLVDQEHIEMEARRFNEVVPVTDVESATLRLASSQDANRPPNQSTQRKPTSKRKRPLPRSRRLGRGGTRDSDDEYMPSDGEAPDSSAESEDLAEGPTSPMGSATSADILARREFHTLTDAINVAADYTLPIELMAKLGQAYIQLQQPETGFLYLASLWATDPPTYVDLFYETIEVLTRSGYYQYAYDACQILLTQEATAFASVWALAGTCLRELHRTDEAITCYETAAEGDPTDLDSQLSLAEIFQEHGDIPQALEWFQRVEQGRESLVTGNETDSQNQPSASAGNAARDSEAALLRLKRHSARRQTTQEHKLLLRLQALARRQERQEKDVALWCNILHLLKQRIESLEHQQTRSSQLSPSTPTPGADTPTDQLLVLPNYRQQIQAAREKFCHISNKLYNLFRHVREFYFTDRSRKFTCYSRWLTKRIPSRAAVAVLLNQAAEKSAPTEPLEERICQLLIGHQIDPAVVSLVRGHAVSTATVPLVPKASEQCSTAMEDDSVSDALQPSSPPAPHSSQELVTQDDITPTILRGMPFSSWLEVFIDYSLQLAYLGRIKDALQLLGNVMHANIFFYDHDASRQLHFISLALASRFGNFDLLYPLCRQWVSDVAFFEPILRLFSAMLCDGPRESMYYTYPVVTKLITRHLLLLSPTSTRPIPVDHALSLNDTVLAGRCADTTIPSSVTNTSTRKSARVNKLRRYLGAMGFRSAYFDSLMNRVDAPLMGLGSQLSERCSHLCIRQMLVLKGYFHLANGSIINAFKAFQAAHDLYPNDLHLKLCMGLSLIQRAMQRRSPNRHLVILEGFKHLFTYFETTMAASDDSPLINFEGTEAVDSTSLVQRRKRFEALFNIGRAFHLLGLVSLAVPYYECVLGMRATQGLDLTRESQRLACDSVRHNSPLDSEAVDDLLCPFRHEAAYNLAQIYMHSGNPGLAQHMLVTYCTI